MKLSDFTMPEIRRLISECNFTKDERMLFDYRCADIPLEECAELMNMSISAIKHKSQKINNKISRTFKAL